MLPVDGFRRRSVKLRKAENISFPDVLFNFNVHFIFALHHVDSTPWHVNIRGHFFCYDK